MTTTDYVICPAPGADVPVRCWDERHGFTDGMYEHMREVQPCMICGWEEGDKVDEVCPERTPTDSD